jgi:hypothetical protein
VLRGYHEAVQETRNERDSSMKILAKYTRVQDPEILAEAYRIYGVKHLQKSIRVDLEAVGQLMKSLGKEAAAANPASIVDGSLVQELERDGFLKERSR